MKRFILTGLLGLLAGLAVLQNPMEPAYFFSREGANDPDATLQRGLDADGNVQLELLLSTSDTELYNWPQPSELHIAGSFQETLAYGPTVADHVDSIFFIASKPFTVLEATVVWGTAESTGAMDVMLERLQATEACGSGDDLFAAVVDATATADTATSPALTATAALLDLAAGDRLCLDLTATPNEITELTVSVLLRPN